MTWIPGWHSAFSLWEGQIPTSFRASHNITSARCLGSREWEREILFTAYVRTVPRTFGPAGARNKAVDWASSTLATAASYR
jgi:hypothetical protein